MKYLLSALFFLSFVLMPTKALATDIGVQIPLDQGQATLRRLVPSQYSFQWIKYQFSLGSIQPLTTVVNDTKGASSGGGNRYKVLVSVAKNEAHIPTLKNPPYPETQAGGVPAYTQKYCPWDDELDTFDEGTGEFYECGGEDEFGQPNMCERTRTVVIPARTGNGYIEFRDAMKTLGGQLKTMNVDAVEVWNEPNLAREWEEVGLGPVNPKNYANFLVCGIKGLKAGGYEGKIISAAPSPLSASDGSNIKDIDFFTAFHNEYYHPSDARANPHDDNIDAFGWHGNVTSMSLEPKNDNPMGFKRFNLLINSNLLGNKKIWLTEYGWQRADSLAQDSDVKKQQQARFITQAYELVKKEYSSKIENMFVWNFGFTRAGQTAIEFVLWDIEGTPPAGSLCQPNPEISNQPERGDTKYVQDRSLDKHELAATVAGQALIPEIVRRDAARQVPTPSRTPVDVTKGFISTIPNLLEQLLSFLQSTLCVLTNQYCTPNISLGGPEPETFIRNAMAPGKNTPRFASEAKVLGSAAIPQNMELIPEKNDCNIGNLSGAEDPGNTNINDLSKTLGTTTGFYGNGMPDFKSLNNAGWEASMSGQMQLENLNLSNKLFVQDRRSPDIYLRKQVFCEGNYPNGICPFETPPRQI